MYKYANVGHCSATSDKRQATSDIFTCDMNDGNHDGHHDGHHDGNDGTHHGNCDGNRDGHHDGNDALHTPFFFSIPQFAQGASYKMVPPMCVLEVHQ